MPALPHVTPQRQFITLAFWLVGLACSISAQQLPLKSYTTVQGLSANSTMSITEDLYGRIYVATGRGLDQLNPETGRIKHFTTDDGLAPGNLLGAFRDRTGAIWVGTHRGLSRFVPAPAETAPPPPILITGLRVAGERQSVSARGETAITLADLAPIADRHPQRSLAPAPRQGTGWRRRIARADREHFARPGGFDPNGGATPGRNGNGLASMRERARALGGEIEIISQANLGTSIKLNLPLNPRIGSRWRR